jgi:hypothetical protein
VEEDGILAVYRVAEVVSLENDLELAEIFDGVLNAGNHPKLLSV